MGKILLVPYIYICIAFCLENHLRPAFTLMCSFSSYANITIGKQLSHSADLYDAAKLNYKVKSPVLSLSTFICSTLKINSQ